MQKTQKHNVNIGKWEQILLFVKQLPIIEDLGPLTIQLPEPMKKIQKSDSIQMYNSNI